MLLSVPGEGIPPLAEDLGIFFAILLVGILLIIILLVVLIEPLIYLLSKKGKKVALLSALFNGVTVIASGIGVMLDYSIPGGFLRITFIGVILLSQGFKVYMLHKIDPRTKAVSIIFAVLIVLGYLLL